MSPQNLTTEHPSAIVPPESDTRFDQELAGWFALHGGVWSGTAAELLAAVKTRVDVCSDLWSHSPRALYAHIESHMQILRSLGVEVRLPNGNPRMISLRGGQDQKPSRKSPSAVPELNRITSDRTINLLPLPDNQKMSSAHCTEVLVVNETVSQDIPKVKSELAERLANGKRAGEENFEGRVFESPGEALFSIVEMQGRIRAQGLDLKSAIDLVVGRTQEITRCSGVAVGLLEQGSVVYPARAGIAVTKAGLHFLANLFQSCLTKGEAVQLPDAQSDPVVGATCWREGIRSLIIVPIFHNRDVAGAMEFLFKETRSFSAADVMDLELIAGIVSQYLSVAEIELKQPGGREWPPKPNTIQNLALQVGHPLNEKTGLIHASLSHSRDPIDATLVSKPAIPESSKPNTISNLASARTPLWPALKKAWMSIRST